MKVSKIDVYWNNNFSNKAKLQIYIDDAPDYSQIMKYECRQDRLYYAYDEETGLVNFYYDNPRDHEGYGGRKFELVMKDGSSKELHGPWSSRPEVMHLAGFPLCTSVTLKEDKYKYCGLSADMLNSKLESLIKEFLPDLEYYVCNTGEIFIPKNQPLNTEFSDSYAEKRGDRDPNPPKYDNGVNSKTSSINSGASGTQAHIIGF